MAWHLRNPVTKWEVEAYWCLIPAFSEVPEKSAWFLAHRIKETFEFSWLPGFNGPIEADETFMGGKRRNMSHDKREGLTTGRGTVGKAVVAGFQDRKTGQVGARVFKGTDAVTLKGFVR